METFQAVFYRDPAGREPVRELIVLMDADARSAIGRQIDRLNLLSDSLPHLPFPHSSQVDGELRELRCHYGKDLYRILYRRSERLIVLLHIFAKRSAKIDQRDIRIAQDRWTDFRARMDAPQRTPPRPAGHDAP